MTEENTYRIESESEIKTYLQDLRYALDNGAEITFQAERRVEADRNIQYTNKYTIAQLFPDENPIDALRRELKELLNGIGNHTAFVMSFHFAMKKFTDSMFPYKTQK